MGTDIAVRQATIHDLELIVPLFDGYRQFYRQPSDIDLARRFIRDRFEHNESVIFLALDASGAAVGFTQLFPWFSIRAARRAFILNDLFVAHEVRRKGVGALLLNAAAEHARAVGAVQLRLSTEVTNLTGQALYEREGWKRDTDFYVYNLAL